MPVKLSSRDFISVLKVSQASFGKRHLTGDTFDQRGLSGSVVPCNRQLLARPKLQIKVTENPFVLESFSGSF
jgi:hypothetical protein